MSNSRNIAFTICSNNYLGQANALKRSLLRYNDDFEFVIVVIDRPSDHIDYTEFQPAQLIFIEDLKVVPIQELIDRFDIIELNTSVKPTVFKYLIDQYPETERIYYLDPDLYFYGSLKEINEELETASMVLTPHIVNPIPRDDKLPEENTFLNFGIYNLGFCGMNPKHSETPNILDWWEERTLYHGFNNTKRGYFVDQLWMAQAPLFFRHTTVIKAFGYNMAPWNLHERRILEHNEEGILLNDGSLLVFYHFSKLAENEVDVSREYDRYQLPDFPHLEALYQDYRKVLKETKFNEYKNIPIAFDLNSWRNSEGKRPFFKRILRRIGKSLVRMTNT